MQSTASTGAPTTSAPLPLTVSPRSLAAAFARVPDPRRVKSITYPLPALLTLAVAAILSRHLSVLAIAEWGARQTPEVLRALGLPEGRTPCQSTLQRLFGKLDGHALAAALSAHFAPPAVPVPAPAAAGRHGVAVDGKAQRGRLPGARAHGLLPHPWRGLGPRADRARGRQGGGGTDRRPGAARPRGLARARAHRRRPLLPTPSVPTGAGCGWGLSAAGQG